MMKKIKRDNRKMLRSKYNEDENLIFKFRLDYGLSQMALATMCDTYCQNIRLLETGLQSPVIERNYKGLSTGTLRPVAEKLCKVFDTTPAELFPRYFCSLKRQELIARQKLNITCGSWRKFSVIDEILNKEKNFIIWSVMDELNQRDKFILCSRIIEGKTLKEIGIVLGISKDRVRQIEGRALRFLRVWMPRGLRKAYADF